jgi:hypothetical protein
VKGALQPASIDTNLTEATFADVSLTNSSIIDSSLSGMRVNGMAGQSILVLDRAPFDVDVDWLPDVLQIAEDTAVGNRGFSHQQSADYFGYCVPGSLGVGHLRHGERQASQARQVRQRQPAWVGLAVSDLRQNATAAP